ncbi:MAG: hypothetical protein AABW79_00395 [Nanoarchaeota archaeon]
MIQFLDARWIFFLIILFGLIVAFYKRDELLPVSLLTGGIFALGFTLSSSKLYFFSVAVVAYGFLIAKMSEKEIGVIKNKIILVFSLLVVISIIFFFLKRWEVIFFASGVIMTGISLLYIKSKV